MYLFTLFVSQVLVLPRITTQVPGELAVAVSAMDSLASNVYSPPERILLAWLNHHYRQQKGLVFRGKGTVYCDNFYAYMCIYVRTYIWIL